MLKSLGLTNFTVFPDAELRFGRQLNVFIGENGAGKTHLLKAAYCGLAASEARTMGLQEALAAKLQGVFRPDALGRLVRRARGRSSCRVTYSFWESELDMEFTISTLSNLRVASMPASRVANRPVFIPTRELLTIAPGFVSLFETTHLPFEETWRDTCILLEAPLARGPREAKIAELVQPLEDAMGGKVWIDGAGRFCLTTATGNMEMHLVAEGLRKLAMIARLVATGSLVDKGCIFWDEPEANLNPRIIKAVARTILRLAAGGIQTFIGTHSLFLLRELHILQESEFPHFEARYFGLHLQADGSVAIQQAANMDEIGDIAALDEDLKQSDRYLATEMDLVEKGL